MPKSQFQNVLLNSLSAADLDLLGPLETVTLVLNESVQKAQAPIEVVFFPEDCLLSVVANAPRGTIEVGLIGLEGVSGSGVIHGDTQSPFETLCQGGGTAHRLEAARLASALERSVSLRRSLLQYARYYEIQVASTSIANGQAVLEERLARWILMVADRMGPSFDITHDFLASMLAVRRPGVTVALEILEGRRMIESTRGHLRVLDRDGLIATANGSYGLPEREYERLRSLSGIGQTIALSNSTS